MATILIALCTGEEQVRQAAERIAEGVKRVGCDTGVCQAGDAAAVGQFDGAIFCFAPPVIGSLPTSVTDFASRVAAPKVAVAVIHSGNGKPVLAAFSESLAKENRAPINTLLLAPRGLLKMFGRGKLSESDLVRASGFGERTANAILGVKISKTSEKDKIAGYKK